MEKSYYIMQLQKFYIIIYCNPITGKPGVKKREHMNDFKKAKEQMIKINDERIELYLTLRTRNRSKQLEDLKLLHAKENLDKNYKTALLEHTMKNEHEFKYDQMIPIHYETEKRKIQMLDYSHHLNACNFKQDTLNLNVQSKQVVNAYNFLIQRK